MSKPTRTPRTPEQEAARAARLTESLHVRLYAGLRTTDDTFRGVPHRVWTGAIDAYGYGVIWDGLHGNNRKVHRLLWQVERGDIPDETIDHYCGRKDCAEPIHVEPASVAANVKRAEPWAFQSAKTHCPRGHSYDATNTYLRPDGKGRDCLACLHAASRARAAGRPISRRDLPTVRQ